jgi:putative ABC transport system permease protein
MPPGVRFLPAPGASQEPNYNLNAMVEYWVPGTVNPKGLKDRVFNVVVRLKDGVALSQAQVELSAMAARLGQSDRDLDGFTPRLVSLTAELNRDGRGILLPLLGAAALVLLIACGNVAALLLVRGLQRQQEYAVRSAMGMGRWGLLRQVSAEALLLASAGRGAGDRGGKGVAGDRRARDSTAGLGDYGMDGAGVGIRHGGGGGGFGGGDSGAAGVAAGSDRGAEVRGAEE